MKRKVIEIDQNGMFVCDRLIDVNTPVPENCIETPIPPNSVFYHPKWDFESNQWVEGLTQEEIDLINQSNNPETNPIEILEAETAMLGLELAQAQIRIEQLEQEQANLVLLLVAEGVL